MTLDDLTALIERDLPGWGWLVRNVPERRRIRQDWEAPASREEASGKFFANLTSPEFDQSTNRDVRDPETGHTASYSTKTGHQTAFPRYSANSGIEALLMSYCWALDTKLGTEERPEGSSYQRTLRPDQEQGAQQSRIAARIVERYPDRFPSLLADGRPALPEGHSAELPSEVAPGWKPLPGHWGWGEDK